MQLRPQPMTAEKPSSHRGFLAVGDSRRRAVEWACKPSCRSSRMASNGALCEILGPLAARIPTPSSFGEDPAQR